MNKFNKKPSSSWVLWEPYSPKAITSTSVHAVLYSCDTLFRSADGAFTSLYWFLEIFAKGSLENLVIHQDKRLPEVTCLDLNDPHGLQLSITFSCRRCPNVKYLSRTIRVPITFCIASQCLVLSAAFLRLVMTGMPCLKLITFCFSLGTTLLGGRPKKKNKCQ